MKRRLILLFAASAAIAGFAQGQGGSREAFLREQAYAEMQRVSGQVDVLASNQEELGERLVKVEALKNEIAELRAEIAALKATNAELRNRIPALVNEARAEIVKDLTGKIAMMQTKLAASVQPAPPPRRQTSTGAAQSAPPQPVGPHREYVVKSGDTLSLISTVFKTPISRIKEMNGLKSDMIRPGQKLILPL